MQAATTNSSWKETGTVVYNDIRKIISGQNSRPDWGNLDNSWFAGRQINDKIMSLGQIYYWPGGKARNYEIITAQNNN